MTGLVPIAVVSFETVPWWLPIVVVAIGLLLYGAPQVDAVIGARAPEWRQLPGFVRAPVVGLLVAGAGLIVFAQLAEADWMYVLFLFGYARAVEGATILNLFGRVDEAMSVLLGKGSSSQKTTRGWPATIVRWLPLVSVTSTVGQGAVWLLGRTLKRLPLVIVTGLITTLSVALLVVVLVGFSQTSLTVRIAAVVTVSTFALSLVNTAWILTKVTDELAPWEFIGVVCCIVGGELYNVPSVAGLFPGIPAVEGPFSAWTAVAVGTVGWAVGVLLAVAFFTHRVRTTRPK